MLAVHRTTELFVASLKDALPTVEVRVQRSKNRAGRSNYIYITRTRAMPIKVRVSDHPIGMRRALRGDEQLYIPAGARPASWSVWIGDLVRRMSNTN